MSAASLLEEPATAVDEVTMLPPMMRLALGPNQPAGTDWDTLLAQLGVACPPIGAEALQEAMMAAGHDPTSREFSQDLIAHREE